MRAKVVVFTCLFKNVIAVVDVKLLSSLTSLVRALFFRESCLFATMRALVIGLSDIMPSVTNAQRGFNSHKLSILWFHPTFRA